jgi:NTE family protein
LIEHGWMEDGKGPDIIAGTSIGAINAAALASGLTIEQLKQRWLAMHTEEVHRLSNDLPAVTRPMMRFLLRSVLTSEAHGGAQEKLPEEDRNVSTQGLLSRLTTLFHATPFRSLLDTSPWRHTLKSWMNFDRINGPDAPALLLAATELQSGALKMFCNRERKGQPRDVITLDHLMASSSIPMMYPWTEIGEGKYWDGAVLANTPLGPVIDLAGDDDLEIVVILMTPWNEDATSFQAQLQGMPKDLVQALTLTLDWALLASYRAALKQLKTYNRLAQAEQQLKRAAEVTGDNSFLMGRMPRYIAEPTVIAPENLMPLDWIVDYEDANHHTLFEMGRADAERTFA